MKNIDNNFKHTAKRIENIQIALKYFLFAINLFCLFYLFLIIIQYKYVFILSAFVTKQTRIEKLPNIMN